MLESVPVPQILTCLIVGILVASFNALRRPSILLALCVPGLIAAYRYALIGYLLSSGAVFVFTAAAARLSVGHGQAFRWRLCCAGILVLVIAFLAGRWCELGSRSVSLAGADWRLFSLEMWPLLRLITFLWEIGSGRVKLPSLGRFAMWACLPFTLFGPVLRYSEFDSEFQKSPSADATYSPSSREGLRMLAAVAQLGAAVALVKLHGSLFQVGGFAAPTWQKLLDAFVLGPWGFLLMWSGYFRLMECFAPMWGLRLPPSFNWPFGRANISEFWANWNMTATSVFRDYLFYTRWGTRRPNLYINTLIIFFLVGLWHGLNLYWVLFGLLHGIGFCCFIWYRQRRELKRFEATWIPGQLFGRVVTYVFVCSCWVLPSQILKFFGKL